MRKLFYARLALDNIRKNARTYIPYILSCVFTVAMTYILYMLPEDPGLTGTRGEVTIRSTLVLGSFVVTIFAVIFLFYTSSFLTKRRRKEFGLLNVLGFLPPQAPFDALEISRALPCPPDPGIPGYPHLHSSDAHRLEDILERQAFLPLDAPTPSAFFDYIRSWKNVTG